MAPTEPSDQTLNTNTPETEPQHKSWWPLWLLGGLILLFLLTIIILRSLCTDVWYINLLKLNDNLCNSSNVNSSSGTNIRPGLALEGNSLTIEGGNTIVLPVKEGPEGKEGPKGSAGSKGSAGAKGENGSTGPIGPAGPTDPCVVNGTYFCQNGNSYGTLAVLGTNDAQDLQVVTGGVNSALFDTSGNITLNALESSGAPANAVAPTAFGNFLINENAALGSSILGGSTGNFFALQDSTITDVAASQGAIINSTVSNSSMLNGVITGSTIVNSIGFTGYISGGSVSDSYGLNGRFDGSSIASSSDLLGGYTGSTVSSSNGILAQLGSSTMTGVSNSIVYLTNGSITGSNNSLINVDGTGSVFDNVDYSVVIGQNNLLVTDAYESTVMGSFNTINNISSSAVLGTGNTATNLVRVTANGVGVDISDSHNSSLVGFAVTANDLSWSNLNSFASTLNEVGWSDLRVNSSDLTNVNQFGGYIQGFSVLTNVHSGTANVSASIINDSAGLTGLFVLANVDNSTNLYGTFGGYCDGVNPDTPPFGCNLGYDIQFDIDNSDGIHGSSRWVNIYDSSRLFVQAGSSDPLLFSGTIDSSAYDLLVVRDSDVVDTSFSNVIGHNLSITGLDYSSYIGRGSTIDATADPTYDYSFLGSDSTGAINTRINSKGDDSWLNLSGGNVGLGTTTPANKLDVTDSADDTPASFTGTSGTCTVDTFGGGWSCVSDQKLKTNILSIGNGLEAVLALQGVTYNWKSSPDGQAVSGFIAQEVEKVLPGLVTELADGTKSLNKDGMLPYIIEAIKTQDGKLEGVNTELASQGLKIDNLSDDLKALAGKVDNLQKEFEQYKLNTDVRIKNLEDKLNSQVAAPATPVNP